MFGDDPLNRTEVAASIAKQAADPRAWLEQAYRLKRLADELIQRWLDAMDNAAEIQRRYHEQYPVDYWTRPDIQPGDVVFPRAGEREAEAKMWEVRSQAAAGSSQVYMMLAGQAVENLAKGLYVKNHPAVVRSAEQVAAGKAVLNWPTGGHDTVALLTHTGFDLSEEERNIANRLSLAVQWHGRYPVPLRHRQTHVAQIGDHEDSISLGYWSSAWCPVIDALYERLFAELVGPGWYPWWEPDKIPR